MTSKKKPVSNFEDDDGFNNSCHQCRWFQTVMCPKQLEFVGRQLHNNEGYFREFDICHRFTLTAKERDRRWEIVMNKLHEGIDHDI